jgi:hypothetical protein
MYKDLNPCLASCFEFIKKIFANFTYIDRITIIRILNENCDKINAKILEGYVPIVIIPSCEINKSNLFFTLCFLYLYNKKYPKKVQDESQPEIQLIVTKICGDHLDNDSLFYLEGGRLFNFAISEFKTTGELEATSELKNTSGLKSDIKLEKTSGPESGVKLEDTRGLESDIKLENTSGSEKLESINKFKYLGIICDDFLYSGNQMVLNLFREDRDSSRIYTFPDNFKYYINCIGCTPVAFNRITNKINNWENHLIISDETYIKKKDLSVESIIRNTFPEHDGMDIIQLIRNMCLKNDVFILKKNKSEQIIVYSILFNFIRKIFLDGTIRDITMIYLFFKYPDEVSTLQDLCGFFLSKDYEEKYYVIQDIKSRIVNNYRGILPLSEALVDIDHSRYYFKQIPLETQFDEFVGEFNINKILTMEEIQQIILNWDNLDEKTVNILTFKKCENNYTDRIYPLITNCDPKYKKTRNHIDCNACIEPFYKKITWNNPIEGASKKNLSEISTNVYQLIKELSIDESQNLFSKYLKYKNKYLELKKSLSKK